MRTLVSEVATLTPDVHEKAIALAKEHGFSFYDALIISAALSLACTHLLSEDMQDGRVVEALTIENPFRDEPE